MAYTKPVVTCLIIFFTLVSAIPRFIEMSCKANQWFEIAFMSLITLITVILVLQKKLVSEKTSGVLVLFLIILPIFTVFFPNSRIYLGTFYFVLGIMFALYEFMRGNFTEYLNTKPKDYIFNFFGDKFKKSGRR